METDRTSIITPGQRMANRQRGKPIPEHFQIQLERWDNFRRGNGVFFRPMQGYPDMGPLPQHDEDGVSGSLAMWIKETHGEMISTTEPERFADFLQGKSIEGLSRKEWIADAFTGSFWAEELVVGGLIGFREAERLFVRKLNGDLLWLYATWQSGEPQEGFYGD